jgi:hypothetical protein
MGVRGGSTFIIFVEFIVVHYMIGLGLHPFTVS